MLLTTPVDLITGALDGYRTCHRAGLRTRGCAARCHFDTNVLGTLLSMKHELCVMLPQGHGSIVNVSSTYGRAGAAGASVERRIEAYDRGETQALDGDTAIERMRQFLASRRAGKTSP